MTASLKAQITETELTILGLSAQADSATRSGKMRSEELRTAAAFRASVHRDILKTLRWLEKHETIIRAAIKAAKETTDVE